MAAADRDTGTNYLYRDNSVQPATREEMNFFFKHFSPIILVIRRRKNDLEGLPWGTNLQLRTKNLSGCVSVDADMRYLKKTADSSNNNTCIWNDLFFLKKRNQSWKRVTDAKLSGNFLSVTAKYLELLREKIKRLHFLPLKCSNRVRQLKKTTKN